ncbi:MULTISPECIES: ABC transporter ATP-binding protein [Flagellimonas]|uniref:ABC transporter ATP-binding protein n=1 Tax=Flagellimonas hadalis TaxID=2597517 RepID=A0A5N5IQX6_9FLAO|nr:ABC transporter ATP-binding protein [Allomuricauda hadalis]KAB5484754.1 ABC transporter ATP-binding protein [Allomuricauda hadalis]
MSILSLFKKILPFIKPYKWLLIATLCLTLIGSVMAQVNAYILRYTVDELTVITQNPDPMQQGARLLLIISIILIAKELIYAAIQFGQKFYGEKLRIFISRDFAQLVVDKILSYRMAFYTASNNESGKLQTRIDMGISSLTRLVRNFFIDILPLFANALLALIAMFNANVWVGLVSLSIIPIYFYVSNLQAKRLSGFRRSLRNYRETKSNAIISIINSITVIKSFTREPLEADKHEKIQFDMTENQMKTRHTSFMFDSIKSMLEQVGVVVVIILTAFFVLNGTMSIGAIMFHIMLFGNVTSPIRQLHRIYDEINDALIYSESFFEIMEADDEKETSGSYIPSELKGNIELKNVDFTYPNGTKALHNVSMTIPANTITALVGLSGAGKSTVVNLLDKFYQPQSGKILLDNVDLMEYDTNWLRNNIGLVLQRNHIFHGSIKENILYGKPNATDDEVFLAAKKAHIHDQVMELPKGYDSEANLLSGGQQQRISIARMFLKNPPIIFLDEPTASLDAIATQEIKNSLDAIKKDRTVIIISHSISQIIDAENVVVMDKGRVMEQGTHEQLYAQNGKYHEIFSAMASSLNLDKISDTLNDQQ